MVNYQNGKIYKLESLTNGKIYIGSTCQSLAVRLGGHKKLYKHYLKGKYRYVSSFELLESGDAKIYLIETFPCNSREELCAREGYWIKKMDCVNKNVAGRTKKEWCQYNTDKIKKQNKQYYQANVDKLKEKNKQYKQDNTDKLTKITICDCGGKFQHRDKTKHFKTKKHQKFIQQCPDL